MNLNKKRIVEGWDLLDYLSLTKHELYGTLELDDFFIEENLLVNKLQEHYKRKILMAICIHSKYARKKRRGKKKGQFCR